MSVTIDHISSGNGSPAGTNSSFWNTNTIANGNQDGASFMTISAGATFLLVGAQVTGDPATQGTNSFVWDQGGTNQAMTSLGAAVYNSGSGFQFQFFGLVNPTSGTKTLRLTNAGNTSGNANAVIFGISFNGTASASVAAATEGYATNTDGGSTSATASVSSGVSIPSGDMAVAFYLMGTGGGAAFPTDGGTFGDMAFGNSRLYESYSGAGATINSSYASTVSQFWTAGIVGIKASVTVVQVGKLPSTLLLPLMQRPNFRPRAQMVGWRGLRQLKAFPPPFTPIALSGRATIMIQASAAATGKTAAAARSTIMVQARAAARGTVPVTGQATTMVKAAAGSRGASAMAGRATVQTKAAAAPTGAAALAGRATTMLKAAAAASGIVPLAGQAAIMVKAAAGIATGSFIALSGAIAVMVKASAASTSAAALSARATTMTKASAAASGAAALAGQATIMIKAAGGVATGAFVALSGMCTVMVKAAAQQASAVAIAGNLTIQVKAQSGSPVQPPSGTVQFILKSSGSRFIGPGHVT